MQLESCTSTSSNQSKYTKEELPVQSDSYYSLYFASDVENKRDVLWVDLSIEGSSETDIHCYMSNVQSCISNNPNLFVSFYDYWISPDKMKLSIITERPVYGCMTDFIQNTSNYYKNNANHDDTIHLIKVWLMSLLRMMDVTQVNDPPILMSSLSTNSIFFTEGYETIKLALFPFILNSGLLNSCDMLRYIPMETIQHGTINSSTIMYSLGVCLYEMLTKSNLFACCDCETLLQLKTDDHYIRKEIACIDDIFFRDLVIRLLGPSADRPSYQSILHELKWISTDSSNSGFESSSSLRYQPPTMQVLMNSKSNPSSVRNSLNPDREDFDFLFPERSSIPEYEVLGKPIPVDYYKLNLTYDLTDTGYIPLGINNDHISFSILSRVHSYLKVRVTRTRTEKNSKMTYYVLLKYGEMAVPDFVSRLSQLNLVPEVMMEIVTEYVELWLDNFVKSEFGERH